MRVVVVGAGVVGLAVALQAAADGHAVSVLDGAAEGAASASVGNAGLIVPSHVIPLAAPGLARRALHDVLRPGAPVGVRLRPDRDVARWLLEFRRASTRQHVDRAAPVLRDLLLASRAGFEEWAALGDIGLQRHGLLLLCRTGRALHDEARDGAYARRLGLRADVLDAAGVATLDPAWAQGSAAGGVHFPGDWHVDPVRVVAALRSEAARRGVDVQWSAPVRGFATAGGTVTAVRTAAGDIAADRVVVAAGAATPAVVRELGIDLPLVGGRGYGLDLVADRPAPRVPAILHEPRVAVTPLADRLRVTGVLELGQRRSEVVGRRLRAMLGGLEAFLPGWGQDAGAATPWAALRPCTPDGLPYLGYLPGYANAIVASGHCMLGLTLAPVTGRIVGALLRGEAPPVATTGLEPARYARPTRVSRGA